jgi:hypothetical protein
MGLRVAFASKVVRSAETHTHKKNASQQKPTGISVHLFEAFNCERSNLADQNS